MVILFTLLFSLSYSTFTNWDNLELPISLIYDFVLIENDSILLVVEGFEGNATRIVAVNLMGDQMAIISVYQNFCPDLEGNSYQASEFVALNNTAVALHCQFIAPGYIPWSAVYVLSWDSQSKSIITSPQYGLFKPGWLFIMPTPTYSSASFDPTHVWFWDNSINAVSVRISAVDINTMTISKEHVFEPGLNFGSSFLDPRAHQGDTGYVVIAQNYLGTIVLTKYSLETWEKMAMMTLDISYSFALSGIDTAAYLQTATSFGIYSQCDYTSWICSPLLNITFSTYVAYPGNSGWPASGFSGSYGYFVLQVSDENDNYTSYLYQVLLGGVETPPKVVGTIIFPYTYSHNLLATPNYIYIDTDESVISRVGINQ